MIVRRKRYLHLGISVVAPIPTEVLEAKFAKDEWARYGAANWMLYTDRTAAAIRDDVRSIASLAGGNILVVEIIPTEADGWLPEWMWTWLHKPR